MNFAVKIMILSFIKDKTCGLLTFVLYKMYCPKTHAHLLPVFYIQQELKA